MEIPRIETARLVLRGWEMAEFERMAAIYADAEVGRFIGGARAPGASWDAFLRNFGTWAQFGYGMWAVEERAGGQMIGQLGFARRRRGLGAEFDAAPEAGWTLATSGQGRGLGREAMAAALSWFDAQTFGARSHAVIDLRNAPSLRLAERLGYRRWQEAELSGEPVVTLWRARVGERASGR